MTTLVAVRKHDQIAIAADSLTTFGDVKLDARHDRSSDKIIAYRGNYIGLCGSAAHQLVFESLLKPSSDYDFGTRLAIFETLQKLHPILKDKHFLNPKEEEDDPYESTQITALVANALSQPDIQPRAMENALADRRNTAGSNTEIAAHGASPRATKARSRTV